MLCNLLPLPLTLTLTPTLVPTPLHFPELTLMLKLALTLMLKLALTLTLTDNLVRSMQIKTNDMHLMMYVTSLIRSVLALHTLLLNKIKYKNVDDINIGNDDDDAKTKSEKLDKKQITDKPLALDGDGDGDVESKDKK
jgi:hypothetical protein